MLEETHRSETSKPRQSRRGLLSGSSGGHRLRRVAYRGRVVSECLQVSDICVDKPPRALDVHAHVVIGSIGDGDSHTEADMSSEVYQSPPAGGGIITLACIYITVHARSIRRVSAAGLRGLNATHMMKTDVATSEAV